MMMMEKAMVRFRCRGALSDRAPCARLFHGLLAHNFKDLGLHALDALLNIAVLVGVCLQAPIL